MGPHFSLAFQFEPLTERRDSLRAEVTNFVCNLFQTKKEASVFWVQDPSFFEGVTRGNTPLK